MFSLYESSNGFISIVPQCRAHAGEMYEVLCDNDLYKFTGGEPPVSVHWLAERFSKLESRRSPDEKEYWLNWVVFDEVARALVGYVQATIAGDKADVAWVIGVKAQGRGYATSASRLMIDQLTKFGISDLTCHIGDNNIPSIRVAEKLGFINSGVVDDGENIWRLEVRSKTSN